VGGGGHQIDLRDKEGVESAQPERPRAIMVAVVRIMRSLWFASCGRCGMRSLWFASCGRCG
jgi:hypothetical protein